MRKQDYAILAVAIKRQISDAQTVVRNPQSSLPDSDHASGQLAAARTIAREFAECASVDKSAFLRACGIE